MLSTYTWLQTQLYLMGRQFEARLEDEAGLETVEYIAMIFVALVLLLAVATVLSKDTKIGEAFVTKAVEFITQLGAGA